MAPPPWVAGGLAAVLLAIAGYCASRLVAARRWQRSTDHGVDVMHAVMGVAMAGMLVPRLNPLQARVWAVLFTAGTAWFGWQIMRDRRRRAARQGPGPAAGLPAPAYAAGGHHGAHVLSCAAMVCMLLAAPDLAAPGLGATMRAGRGAVPVVALLLAVAVAVSVVVSTDRISALRPAPVTPAPAGAGLAGGGRPATAPACAQPALCPRLAASCQIVMGVAMAYMLILML
jgi:hypothetical protein